MNESPQASRRSFYLSFIYGLWALLSAALTAPALVYLLLPPKLRDREDWVEAGDIDKLADKAPMELTFRQMRRDGWKVSSEQRTAWVVKLGDQVVAFGPQCTHLGCAYHWEAAKGEFLCPCHTSEFGLDGRVISGPAPRPLDRYESRTDKGKLYVRALKESEPTA